MLTAKQLIGKRSLAMLDPDLTERQMIDISRPTDTEIQRMVAFCHALGLKIIEPSITQEASRAMGMQTVE